MFVIGIATINCQLAFNVCWFFAKKILKKQRRKKNIKNEIYIQCRGFVI